ncbi:MAG: alpha,alpha-trehalase TreF [Pseudomonadota bacterium]
MKRKLCDTARAGFALALLFSCLAAFAAPAAAPQPPSVVFRGLFEDVQRSGIFPDSKTFPDSVPNAAPAEILAAYRRERAEPGFELRAFVSRHFTVATIPDAEYVDDSRAGVCAHIDALWPVLTRGPDAAAAGSSLLPLPHRYVVPGGRFREAYYWDTYFTMLGLEASGWHDLVREMIDNFAFLIDTYGHVPNGNRTYYLSRSQPPFFAAMIALAAQRDGEQIYAKYLPQLEREYQFWMEGAATLARGTAHRRVVRLADGAVLNRYWDDRAAPRDEAWREDEATAGAARRPAAEVYRNLRAAAESGWDFSSRWLADGKTLATIRTVDFLPVDLNSLLYQLEIAISRGAAARGDAAASARARALADQRAAEMRRLFWNTKRGAFTDYLWTERRASDAVTAAGLYPLFFDIAERGQAAPLADATRLNLLRPEGIVPTAVRSGQQWDAPNGWAPLQWIAISGFARYGEEGLAQAIAAGWVRENVAEFAKTGKLVEKYDVTGDADARGGEYPTQDGFGWTNGVLRALLANPERTDGCVTRRPGAN